MPELSEDGLPERTRLVDQLGFMKTSRLVTFGWIALTTAVALLVPLGTDTMGFLLIVFAASVIPPAAFAVAWRRSPPFRERMLRLDLGALVLWETGRFAGLAWLVLYSEDQLAGEFAFWGGGIDVLIGLSAATFAYGVTAMRPFPRRLFVGWNLLGVFDFVVAWPLIFLFSATEAGVLAGDGPAATTESALQFPMSIIPMLGVPLMCVVHMIVLLQIRHQREPRVYPLFHPTARGSSRTAPSTASPEAVAR